MSDCLFCQIAQGAIPCEKIYEDQDYLAFNDIDPQAPTHVLIIPRRHVAALTDLEADDRALIGGLGLVAARVASAAGLDDGGYRWVMNCGEDGCQTVPHLHLHLLGGRKLGWPPG